MKQYAVELDGVVLLIFVMYNVLSAGGYSAKKIWRTLFQTLRVCQNLQSPPAREDEDFAVVWQKGRDGEFYNNNEMRPFHFVHVSAEIEL